jgi:hypothetical protein
MIDEERVARICQHEAGHYLTAKILGFRTCGITIQLTDPVVGHIADSTLVLASKLIDIDSIKDYLERRIQVLNSGAIAESIQGGAISNEVALASMESVGSMNDYARVRDLIQLLRSVRYPEASSDAEIQAGLKQIADDLWTRTHELVGGEMQRVVALAKFLATKIEAVGTVYGFNEDEISSIDVMK